MVKPAMTNFYNLSKRSYFKLKSVEIALTDLDNYFV